MCSEDFDYSSKDSESNNSDSLSAPLPSLDSKPLLPSYILKNLSPLRKPVSSRTDHRHLTRKQELLKLRSQKLKERSIVINKRISKLKEQNKISLEAKAHGLKTNLKVAKTRRENYLNTIKEKARNFRKKLSGTNIIKYDNIEHFVITEVCALEDFGSSLSSVIFIQRKIRGYLLQHNIKSLFATGFLQNFNKLSFNQCIKVMQSHSIEKTATISILSHFQIPDLFNNRYSTFFYAFILICDFEDAMKRNVHPGFNSNSDDKTDNLLNNFLWVLVYKLSKEMILIFQKLINSLESIKIKQKFKKTWNYYNFAFKLFKINHLRRIRNIVDQSIVIVEKQIEITNSRDIINQKENLIRESTLLKTYKGCDSDILVDLDESEFINLISLAASSKSPSPQFHYQIISNKITFEGITFVFPIILSKIEWRRYFFLKYIHQLSNQDSFPITLVSGQLSFRHRARIDIDDLLSHLGVLTNFERFNNLIDSDNKKMIIEFIEINNKNFLNLVHYATQFHAFSKSEEKDEIISAYHESRKSRISTLSDVQLFLQQMFSLLIRFLDVNGLTGPLSIIRNCVSILNYDQFTTSTITQIIKCYQDFKIMIDNMWIEKCKFNNFRDYKIFENIFIYVKHNNKIRPSLYTNSPCLKFPRFYEFLNRCNYSLDLNHYLQIFDGVVSLPEILSDHFHERSYKYFRGVFFFSIMKGDFIKHEFNDLYLEDFKYFHKIMHVLLDTNTTLMLLLNFYSSFSSYKISLDKNPDVIFHKIHSKLEDSYPVTDISFFQSIFPTLNDMEAKFSEFCVYHIKHSPSIKKVLSIKLTELCNSESFSPNFTNLLSGNFKYCSSEISSLSYSVNSLLYYIYRLYGPTLDWIYKDIGEPNP